MAKHNGKSKKGIKSPIVPMSKDNRTPRTFNFLSSPEALKQIYPKARIARMIANHSEEDTKKRESSERVGLDGLMVLDRTVNPKEAAKLSFLGVDKKLTNEPQIRSIDQIVREVKDISYKEDASFAIKDLYLVHEVPKKGVITEIAEKLGIERFMDISINVGVTENINDLCGVTVTRYLKDFALPHSPIRNIIPEPTLVEMYKTWEALRGALSQKDLLGITGRRGHPYIPRKELCAAIPKDLPEEIGEYSCGQMKLDLVNQTNEGFGHALAVPRTFERVEPTKIGSEVLDSCELKARVYELVATRQLLLTKTGQTRKEKEGPAAY